MKVTTIITALILAVVTTGTQAVTVYEEDFSSDPGFTLATAPGPHTYEWVSNPGYYRVYFSRDEHAPWRLAQCPEFDELDASDSFTFDIDIYPVNMSWGHHMSMRAAGSDYTQSSFAISYNWDSSFSIGGGGVSQKFSASTGRWYNFAFDYDADTGLVDILVTDLSSGTIKLNLLSQTFNPAAFSRLYFGHHLANSEGSTAQLRFDNISIQTSSEVPEPATLLAGLAGLAGVGRYLRRR